MKFVYFGYDFNLPAVSRLLADGHELAGIFSFEVDNIFNFNQRTKELANNLGIPFEIKAVKTSDIQPFIDKKVDVFIAAGYPHKIPPIDEQDAYAVNVHPTRLPKGRGLMPIPPILLNNLTDTAGFTAHKMTQEFDAGDILLQETFDLSPDETVETYTSKIAIRTPDFFSKLFENLPTLWKNAEPQDEAQATSLKPPSNNERVFRWTESVEEIDKIGRAFGRFGSIAQIREHFYVVYHFDTWKEEHNYVPGTIAAEMSREIVIAVKDGFVCLKDFDQLKA